MKSDFILALNQIVSERSLPREIVTEVLESALSTTYRKNANIMNGQQVAVKVDIDNGSMRVFLEKEVVDSLFDDRTEVLETEIKTDYPDAKIGDTVMVDVTSKELGRIAAQNAKQMIVQKLREAERDFQFNQYAEREGEIVVGVVQSISNGNLTVNLGRAEGLLSKKDHIPGERYDLQQRVRAYVSEVKRGQKGMQIILSRTHKGMLRRLLELEIPEIQKASIEIRAIAREAGSRSKVAVTAKDPNIDPVGACIGQRGTRIQTIVNELHNEKIDIIEYSDDPVQFIGKSLSPAKPMSVYPGNGDGKSAAVIVLDNELSLAIGREGQNARLAAKLTGWRIDIKSVTEALGEALNLLNDNDGFKAYIGVNTVQNMPALRELMVRQRLMPSPLSGEEFQMVKRLLDAVQAFAQAGNSIAKTSAAESPKPNAPRAPQAVAPGVPADTYTIPLRVLELSPRVTQHIAASGIDSVGKLLEYSQRGDERLLSIEGIGSKALSEIKAALDKVIGRPTPPEPPPAPPVPSKPAKPAKAVEAKPEEEDDLDALYGDYEPEEDDVVEAEERSPRGRADKKKDAGGKKSGKDRILVFDESLGRNVIQRNRKPSNSFDFDESE
ncbi:MAG: transcription termination factor NusA [Anaerolineae bacterium]|nr:transcription termination factor NusA [Anaerolineae bacterium]